MTAVGTGTDSVRLLGRRKVPVGALGLGAMGLSGIYGAVAEEEAVATIHAALDRGVTLIDTADVYGDGHNEELIGRALAGRRDEAVIATKTGGGAGTGRGRPEAVRAAIDRSLTRLGVEQIDLYYLHRVDPETPVEETVGVFAELVAAGKVAQIGLSEVSPDELRRAHAVHPIAAVQQEYSLFTRELERDVLPAATELGVTFVAYAPLGRGLLTGKHASVAEIENIDVLAANYPRFAAENFSGNRERVARLGEVAASLGATPAQLALAWVLGSREGILAIPGTRRIANLESNLAALELDLGDETRAELDRLFPVGSTVGSRYNEGALARVHTTPQA